MLDLNHLPKTGNGNIDYFFCDTPTVGITTTYLRTWEKPRGIHTVVITCIGAGGGGASGSAAGGSAAGGSGGGSGGFTRVIIPAMVLPDVLYVSVGKGGAGGAAGVMVASVASFNSGFDGTGSYVSIAPSTNPIYVVCYANGGGRAIAGQISGTAGLAAVVATQANALMGGLGQFFALAGQDGVRQGSGASASIIYPTTGLLLSGGAPGGAPSNAGGNITAPTQSSFSLFSTRTGGAVSNPAGSGADGISLLQPLLSTGGAGGGAAPNSTLNGISGRGGNGGLGSGGGGGGALGGTSAGTSGAGGNGGDGLVIIQTF